MVVGSWPIDISDGVIEMGRFIRSSRGGGGSGANAFVRGVIGDRTKGFIIVIEAGFGVDGGGDMGILWPYIAVTGRVEALLMTEQSPSTLIGNEPRVG